MRKLKGCYICVQFLLAAGCKHETIVRTNYSTVCHQVASLASEASNAAYSNGKNVGTEILKDQEYRIVIAEGSPKQGPYTIVTVSKVDATSSRIQVETIKWGIFKSRVHRIEKARLRQVEERIQRHPGTL